MRWSEGTAVIWGNRMNAGVRKVEELVIERSAGLSGMKVDCRGDGVAQGVG